jgi:hypothetical protein
VGSSTIRTDGAFVGANALTALKAEGGPLQGLDAVFTHRSYNWNEPVVLAELMRELASQGALIAASSEGALFEYGSDDAIISNLKALKAGGSGAIAVAGSVTKDDAIGRRMIANTPFKLFPRGIEGFAPLAAKAGFAIAKIETAPRATEFFCNRGCTRAFLRVLTPARGKERCCKCEKMMVLLSTQRRETASFCRSSM